MNEAVMEKFSKYICADEVLLWCAKPSPSKITFGTVAADLLVSCPIILIAGIFLFFPFCITWFMITHVLFSPLMLILLLFTLLPVSSLILTIYDIYERWVILPRHLAHIYYAMTAQHILFLDEKQGIFERYHMTAIENESFVERADGKGSIVIITPEAAFTESILVYQRHKLSKKLGINLTDLEHCLDVYHLLQTLKQQANKG